MSKVLMVKAANGSAAEQARLRARQAAAHRRTVRALDKKRHAGQRFPTVAPPGPGRTLLVADEPPVSVTLLTVEQPDADGGVGGWEEVQRDGRPPAIVHVGEPRATVSLSLMLDRDELGLWDQGGIEWRLTQLYNMGRKHPETGEPARILLLGDRPAYNPLWVIDSLKPTVKLKTPDGRLRQVAVSIGLSEWVDASLAVTLPPASTRSTRGKTKTRFYVTRQGDTLRRVALAQLGSQGEWRALREANKSRLKGVDPDALLKPGTNLRIAANK